MSNPIEAFRAALREHGLAYSGEIIPDARGPTRFRPDDARGNQKNAWYVLHTDGRPAGSFGDWSTGATHKWVAGSDKTDERASRALREEWKRKRAERDAAIAKQHADRAIYAQKLWDAAPPASNAHPYCVRKGVPATGLRVAYWHKAGVSYALLVPIYCGRELVNLQAIFPAKDEALGRDKDFVKGARKEGCFHPIGKWRHTTPLAIVEGWATGMSVHMATGWSVLVAFDAGNLTHVAKMARKHCPNAEIIIAGDNDCWNPHAGNTGLREAMAAAKAVGGSYRLPTFADTSSKPTDFNDLHALEGLAMVAAQLC